MTVERFLEVLALIDEVEENSNIQTTLEAVASNLTALVSTPGQPSQQSALASNMAKLREGVSILTSELNPADIEAIAAMGGGEFFDRNLADSVSESVSANAMTPSVARDFVQKLASRRASFLSTTRSARSGLEVLQVTPSTLAPGTADVSFLIPRDLFENQLDEFAKELKFISKLFGDYSEAITGTREQVRLETLSSSVPTVVLIAAVPVLSSLADVVHKFLDAWKKLEEIREVRARVAALGIKGKAYNEFTEAISAQIESVVDEATASVIGKYTGDGGRKNELVAALKQGTRRLFGQIEQGLAVRFRASTESDAAPDDEPALRNLAELGRTMEFPTPSDEPLLLSPSEVLEDEAEPPLAAAPNPVKKAAKRVPKLQKRAL